MCTSAEKCSNGVRRIMRISSLLCVIMSCMATLYSCSIPSLDGSWHTSIPISEDGIEGKADILLEIASGKKKAEGHFIGTIPFSLNLEADPGFFDVTSNVDIAGTWRIEKKRKLYVSFNSFSLDLEPSKINYIPDITSEDSIMQAYGGDVLGSLFGALLGITLPMDQIIADTKSSLAKMLEDEINSMCGELVGNEDVFGYIDISDNSFLISEYEGGEQIENDSILTFYKKEQK